MSVTNEEEKRARVSLLPDKASREKLRKARTLRDNISRYGVGASGIGVIIALALIFAYLFYEVFPMLAPVKMESHAEYTMPGGDGRAATTHLTLDRYAEIGARFTQTGQIIFFNAKDGALRSEVQVPRPEGSTITSFGRSESRRSLFVYGFSDGSVLPLKVAYPQTFVAGVRSISPELAYPLGEEPINLGDLNGDTYSALAVVEGRGGYIVAAGTQGGRISVASFSTRSNMFTGRVEISREDYRLPAISRPVAQILVNESLRNLFAVDDRGHLFSFDITDPNHPQLIEEVRLVADGLRVTAAEFLVGTRSLIVGGSDGSVRQWFLVRDETAGTQNMTHIRSFDRHDSAVSYIEPEYTRKGFLTGDESGEVKLHYATSSVTLRSLNVADGPISRLAIAPTNDLALATSEGSDRIDVLTIRNPHPQTSISALWGRVWYEGRDRPEFIWQSTSGDDAFEAKLSLVPLTIGTLKAALFAMLLATPLAIMGAIYTAYFMTPAMRKIVKPSIELMEALPTVILGFLAGIWLAPYIENNLPILITGIVLFPLMMLIFGFAWSRLPDAIRNNVAPGWEAAMLVPVVLLTGWFVIASSPWIEVAFFGGSMRQWLTDVGIPYDQRNALIVGIAMGFAVIPTIFSIAEDAVFNVPRHLTQGSLALGATSWQTVVGVVLLTASPGIFSAVMIGFGRAVGETMIVLMASGNSPIVNFNIFEGMRTLAANIAVELPETAVGSTHFRVLFLSALVLLSFTFLLNTAAELVRQRLRKRYASL
jgi:phosphate transport system permease protein